MQTVNFDIDTLVRENVKVLQPYSSARDEYISTGSPMTFLDANENPFETQINRYPDPHQNELKELLAKQKGVDKAQILLGNGSDEILDLLFRAFCEPKEDNIITLPPTYGMYNVLATINAVENKKVLLTRSFQPDVAQILETADNKSKILFLCSPNNPTGNSFKKEQVIQLLEGFNGLVVIDEAYIDFAAQESWITQLENYPNLVITQTFSKAYGMAGIRLGCCYASAQIIAVLQKIKPPYNVNELTQIKAKQRLEAIDSVKREIKSIIEERTALTKALETIPYIKTIYPTEANFILIKVDNATQRYQELIAKGIVIRNRTNQPLCKNTLRLTIGTTTENTKLIKALKAIA